MPGFTLAYMVFLPLAAAAALVAIRGGRAARWLALAVTSAELFFCLALYAYFHLYGAGAGRWLVAVDRPWIGRYGVRFSLGLDGISLLMVTLSALLFTLCVLVSWRQIKLRAPLFFSMLLFMESGILGVFLATDLVLFYLFWEMMLVPMFFLIGVWGHGRRVYSAVKFFIYTVSGSLFMLASIIGLHVLHGRATGEYTFALDALAGTPLSAAAGALIFAGFILAFGVKVPLVPIHGWLPDAHTDAPTAGSVILAGLMLKTGIYGIIRLGIPLLPAAARAFVPALFGLGIAGVFYASWIAFAQSDMKRLVAYSSISHLGLVVMGVAAWNEVALAGSVLQMVNHGITTGALFIMVGMMDERTHTRDIAAYGGLWNTAPAMSAFFLLFILSSLGLPGLNNFVGEFLIFVGVFRGHPAMAAAAFAGVVATLVYLLRLAQLVLFGAPGEACGPGSGFRDLSLRELAVLAPLALLVILIGVYPRVVLTPLGAPVNSLVEKALDAAVLAGGGLP